MECSQALTFQCSARNLSSLVLLWFVDSTPVAQYTIPVVDQDEYPFLLPSPPELANMILTIEIASASLSGNDRSRANFESTLRISLPSLGRARVTNISCGSFVERKFYTVRAKGMYDCMRVIIHTYINYALCTLSM